MTAAPRLTRAQSIALAVLARWRRDHLSGKPLTWRLRALDPAPTGPTPDWRETSQKVPLGTCRVLERRGLVELRARDVVRESVDHWGRPVQIAINLHEARITPAGVALLEARRQPPAEST